MTFHTTVNRYAFEAGVRSARMNAVADFDLQCALQHLRGDQHSNARFWVERAIKRLLEPIIFEDGVDAAHADAQAHEESEQRAVLSRPDRFEGT